MEHRLAAALLCLLAAMPPALGAALPDTVAGRSSLAVAVVPDYPPMEFRDPATDALAGFEQMIPALATGRVDAILSGMTDLASRHEAATFVDYLRSGPQFFVQQSRAAGFPGVAALCGKAVGASRRTSFPKEIAAWSDTRCAHDPIRIVGTEGSGDARIQLKQGRIDAAVQGSETLPYVMEQKPRAYAPPGAPIAAQLTGIALPVKDAGLQQAVAAALDGLIADGTYRALLAKWHLSDNGIGKATVNAGR